MCADILAYQFLGKLRAKTFVKHFFEDLFPVTQLTAAVVTVTLEVITTFSHVVSRCVVAAMFCLGWLSLGIAMNCFLFPFLL